MQLENPEVLSKMHIIHRCVMVMNVLLRTFRMAQCVLIAGQEGGYIPVSYGWVRVGPQPPLKGSACLLPFIA